MSLSLQAEHVLIFQEQFLMELMLAALPALSVQYLAEKQLLLSAQQILQ